MDAVLPSAGRFRFVTDVAEGAIPTNLNAIIGRAIVDVATGRCFAAGVTLGTMSPM